MGAKDALVKIRNLKVGLPDTFAYYDMKEFEKGFKQSCAFSPRVIKQNRGTMGEGIWLVWLESKLLRHLWREGANRPRSSEVDGNE